MNLDKLWGDALRAGQARLNPIRQRRACAIDGDWEADFNAVRPNAIFFKPPFRYRWLPLALTGLLLVSCKTVLPPSPTQAPPPPPPEERAPPPVQVPDEQAAIKRQQAAAALTDRGRMLMADGQVDPAMRLFEQALSLAPQFGPGYFYLADAWLLKNNWLQAREFHRQAVLYLEGDTAWQKRVDAQQRRIDRAAVSGP